MKNKFIIIFIFIFLICVSIANVHAYTNNGGVTIDNNKAKIFTNYVLTSTEYVYNEAGGTSSASGWVPVRAAKQKTIQYNITDVVGTVTLYIVGTIIDSANTFEIYAPDIGTATSDKITVLEDTDEIRVGAKVTSGGSANVTVWGKFPGI